MRYKKILKFFLYELFILIMEIQVNYNATTHNIKLNENMQLGDILEKSLSNNLLMIHEVYGIYFIENDKSTYFGSDDIPFHFTWKRFTSEFKDITNLYLQSKVEKQSDSFSETLMQRYILYLSTKEDELIARNFETESGTQQNNNNISPMQIFNPNFFINMNNNNNSNTEPAANPSNNNQTSPPQENPIMNQISRMFNLSFPENNVRNQQVFEFTFPLSNQNNNNNAQNSSDNNDEPTIERIFNIQSQPINFSAPSNNIGALMDNLQEVISNVLNERMQQMQNMEDVPVVLTEDQIKELPSGPYKDVKKSDRVDSTQCGMSLEDFEEDTNILLLPCHHAFNYEYIKRWLTENSNKCPTCRAEVAEGIPKEE
jgi:hypothetical protein